MVGIFKLIAVVFEGAQSNDPAKRSRALAAGAALAVLVAVVAVIAYNADDSTSPTANADSTYQAPTTSSPRPDPGAESLAGARYCIDRVQWPCVHEQLTNAANAGASTTAVAAEAASASATHADELVRQAKSARRAERRRLLEEAESALSYTIRFDAQHPTAKKQLAAVRHLRRPPKKASKPAASEPATATDLEAPESTESTLADVPVERPTPQPTYSPTCAENGSCYGDLSETTGRPKTTHVRGYYRKDGTYVRGHYRSSRR